MYILVDNFNDKEISRHRTLKACAEAESRHLSAVKRANGQDSYLTYTVRRADGERMSEEEWDTLQDARVSL